MKVFGLYEEGEGSGDGVDSEAAVEPVMNVLSKYRDDVKAKAKEGPKELFKISDELRDDILPFLGIKLEDQAPGKPSVWKHFDKEELLREREKKVEEKRKKEEEAKAKLDKENDLKSTSPSDYFKKFLPEKYSQYDERGIPTHNSKGEELTKKDRTWAEKQFEKHEKVHKKFIEEGK